MKKIYLIMLSLGVIFLYGCGESSNNVSENIQINNPDIQTSKNIIALGDSLTAGYTLAAEDSYPSQLQKLMQDNGYDYNIINGGKSGDTSQQILERLNWTLGDKKYDLAIVVVGGNDGLGGMSTVTMKENIEKIIDELSKRNIKVVLGGMQLPSNFGVDYTSRFAQVYYDVAKEKNVDFYEFFLTGVALDQNLNLSDGIHPNAEGYKIIADNLFKFLEEKNLINKN